MLEAKEQHSIFPAYRRLLASHILNLKRVMIIDIGPNSTSETGPGLQLNLALHSALRCGPKASERGGFGPFPSKLRCGEKVIRV